MSSELYQYLCDPSRLSKNTTNLIIEYLTDPPKLPFLTELIRKFDTAIDAINWHYYYQNHTVYFADDIFSKRRSDHKYYIGSRKTNIYIFNTI